MGLRAVGGWVPKTRVGTHRARPSLPQPRRLRKSRLPEGFFHPPLGACSIDSYVRPAHGDLTSPVLH